MARRTISDEVTAKAAALHRAGHSFKSISETLKVHPRTAKALVARAAASGEAQHWQEVASRVDARFLEDHFALLLYASSGVSWAVGKDPLDVKTDAAVWLTYQVGEALSPAKDLLDGRGIRVRAEAGILDDGPVEDWVAKGLLVGLKQHEPWLAEALDGPEGWVQLLGSFQALRQELVEQGQRLMASRGYGEGPAQELSAAAVDMVLDDRLREDGERVRTGSQPLLETGADSSDHRWLLEQVGHPERVGPVATAYQAVRVTGAGLKKDIGSLQLRGRPAGQCGLCPSRGGLSP